MHASLFAGACALVASSAIVVKQGVHSARALPSLVAMGHGGAGQVGSGPGQAGLGQAGLGQAGLGQAGLGLAGLGQGAVVEVGLGALHIATPSAEALPTPPPVTSPVEGAALNSPVRWFNARPVTPDETVWMTVTAYSPDERSCGASADGQTATLHSVWTNGMRLVAADPRVFGYGSMLSIPGYADGAIVPVLDCGGAIKGMRLDVLMPTHEQAMAWGVQRVPVTVWRNADGLPDTDPRKAR